MTLLYPTAWLLVKEWTFIGAGLSDYTAHPYILELDATLVNPADGQGNPSPRMVICKRHFVVMIGSSYYDPSYGGQVYASQAEWEANMLSGFVVDRYIYGLKTTIIKKNTDAIETIFTPR